jgi:beta-lactamase regulating signal transducer with metallopeptidase domain
MTEHVAPFVYYLEVHLLYASILYLAAWDLTSIQGPSATWKYWVWFATSVNFVVPLGGFFDRFGAATVSWATQLRGLDDVGVGLSHHLMASAVLAGVWVCGTTVMLARLLVRVHACRRDAHESRRSHSPHTQSFLPLDVPVIASRSVRVPSVQGFMRPNITLPEGIERLLSKSEINAVLLHELTHAKRRDNLIGLIHELGLCVLWFHPLIWLTGFRLALYRELSCDDSVIAHAQGRHLISALAKLAQPEEPSLLQSRASTFMNLRLARLASSRSEMLCNLDLMLTALFGTLLLACILETIAHTAHCFGIRT